MPCHDRGPLFPDCLDPNAAMTTPTPDALTLALQPLLVPAFTLWEAPFTWLEMVAFGLFWSYQLYGDGSLQIFFAVVSLWGWWQWLRGTDQGAPLQVRHLPRRAWLPVFGAGLLLWPAIGWFLDIRTPTDVPYWDAFPTAFSLIGQWLLARKYVENWPTWIGVNLVATALFAYKGLYLTVILYAIFVVLSVLGWKAWRAQVRQP